PDPAAHRAAGDRPLLGPLRLRHRRAVVHALRRERRDDGEPASDHGDSVALLLVRRVIPARVFARAGPVDAGGVGISPVWLRSALTRSSAVRTGAPRGGAHN